MKLKVRQWEARKRNRTILQFVQGKTISCSANKMESLRGGHTDASGPLDVINVDGNGGHEENAEDVDEVRRNQKYFDCGVLGHFARDCRWSGKVKRKQRDARTAA